MVFNCFGTFKSFVIDVVLKQIEPALLGRTGATSGAESVAGDGGGSEGELDGGQEEGTQCDVFGGVQQTHGGSIAK